MENKPLINIKNVSFSFNGKALFERVNLDIFQGDIFMLVGDSGSGLTTFLRLVSGIIKPLKGMIKVFDMDIHNASQYELMKVRQKIGFIFQHDALLNNMTLIENVALPMRYHTNFKEKKIYETAREKLRFVGIEKYEAELPAQLSEECMKRGGFARALALEPSIIFCDELTFGFGGYHSNCILSLIKKLTKENKITPVVVSQDKSIDKNLVDRVGVIKNERIEII